jgi:hypothetical protein
MLMPSVALKSIMLIVVTLTAVMLNVVVPLVHMNLQRTALKR